VNFVLEKPDDWFPHSDSKVVLFRESKGSGAPTVRIDLVLKRDEYRIDSVYTIDRQQIARKMRQKKEWLASRSQGGHSPGAGGIAGWFRMPPASYPSKSGITPARPSNMGKDGGDVEFSMDDDSDDAFRKRYEELFPGEPPVTAETARKSVKEGV
jgi:hypothetical protein